MMRFAIAIAAALLLSSSALAADGAKYRSIGFSLDERYFAFEQYGVQDGSGFAYADVFVLDIAKDAWLAGTPIKALLEDETGSVTAVRAKAKIDSASVLANAGISADAEILAANPFTEITAERSSITFHDHYNNGMGMFGSADNQGSWTLKATSIKVPVEAECDEDMEVLGLKLELRNHLNGETAILHEDSSVPKSRFCALAYDIEAVVQPAGGSEKGTRVAIIGVSRRGFEGADRRFIAIPFK